MSNIHIENIFLLEITLLKKTFRRVIWYIIQNEENVCLFHHEVHIY